MGLWAISNLNNRGAILNNHEHSQPVEGVLERCWVHQHIGAHKSPQRATHHHSRVKE